MRRNGWMVLVGLLIGLVTVAPAAEPEKAKARGILDGQVFVGSYGKAGTDTGKAERFAFRGGRFHVPSMGTYGFAEERYSTTEDDGAMKFTSEGKSRRDQSTMVWRGTVRGEAVEGTMEWRDHRGKVTHYWFRGRVKPPTAAPAGG